MGEFLQNNWFWIALIVFFFWMHGSGAGCGGGHGRGHGTGGGGCGGGHSGRGGGDEPGEDTGKRLPAGSSHGH